MFQWSSGWGNVLYVKRGKVGKKGGIKYADIHSRNTTGEGKREWTG